MRAMARAALWCCALSAWGCADILGIEERVIDPEPGCNTAADCRDSVGPGLFCNAGSCTADAPDNEFCQLRQPTPSKVSEHDWSQGSPVVVGTLHRTNNAGELPRLQAMELAVKEINAAGGLGGSRRLVMVTCDYGGPDGLLDGDSAGALIDQGIDYLASELGASVSFGGNSSASTKRAIDRILARGYAMAYLSSFSTSTQLTNYDDRLAASDPYGLLWRTAPNDSAQAKVLAKLIDADATISSLAIVYVNDPYGVSLQEGVKLELEGLGSVLSTSLHRFDNPSDITASIADVQASGADAMLFIGIDGASVVTAYQALVDSGASAQIVSHFLADAAKDGSTLLDPNLASEVHDIIARAKGTAPFHSVTPHYDTFATNIFAELGVVADNFSFLAQSYDAAYVAGYALAYALAADGAPDGRRVAEGMARLVSGDSIRVGASDWTTAVTALTSGDDAARSIDIDGTGGPLDFDVTTGDAPGPIEIWRSNAAMDAFENCAVCQPDEDCDLSGC